MTKVRSSFYVRGVREDRVQESFVSFVAVR